MSASYDVAIVGGGPAGITAGLYLCRARMNTALVEKMACGGQMLLTDTIENFPGFPEGIKGPELAEWMYKQALHFGLNAMDGEAVKVAKRDGGFALELAGGKKINAHSVIVATGARWNALNVPGEKELTGRGVSYCATCDGPLFKGREVVVIGGGDTALEDALFLTKFAKKVTIVHRRDRLRAAKILQERAQSNKVVEFKLNSMAVEIIGKDRCEAVKIKDVVSGRESSLKTDGVFIFIGLTPNSDCVKEIVNMDEKGYIICNEEMAASVPGMFACGDVRKKAFRQVATAVGDGATAAFSAQHYVEHLKGTEYK